MKKKRNNLFRDCAAHKRIIGHICGGELNMFVSSMSTRIFRRFSRLVWLNYTLGGLVLIVMNTLMKKLYFIKLKILIICLQYSNNIY